MVEGKYRLVNVGPILDVLCQRWEPHGSHPCLEAGQVAQAFDLAGITNTTWAY